MAFPVVQPADVYNDKASLQEASAYTMPYDSSCPRFYVVFSGSAVKYEIRVITLSYFKMMTDWQLILVFIIVYACMGLFIKSRR